MVWHSSFRVHRGAGQVAGDRQNPEQGPGLRRVSVESQSFQQQVAGERMGLRSQESWLLVLAPPFGQIAELSYVSLLSPVQWSQVS